jgi:NAD+ synthase (glutamine-hydrolysing)
MRIWLAAMRSEKGDLKLNLSNHLKKLDDASSRGCELVLFPEMSLTGSVDPLMNPERLIPLKHSNVAALTEATKGSGVAAAFGVAEITESGDAFITQVVASEGRRNGVQRKRHLGEGEEHFSPGVESEIFDIGSHKIGIAICAEAGFDAPFDDASNAGARLVLFPAAPGLHGRRTDEASWKSGFSWWEQSSLGDARRHAKRLGLWIALAGQAGSALDEDFPGFAALVSPNGSVVDRLPDWREGDLIVDIPL